MNNTFTPFLNRDHAVRACSRLQQGLTLIEFMISITLGMLIVVALTLLIARQSATQGEFEKSSRQIENGRYAMGILNDDIQMAGYYGEFSKTSDIAIPATLPDPCSTTVSDIEAAMAFPVQGYDSLPAGSAQRPVCIDPTNHLPGTDILVIRRALPDLVTVATATAATAAGRVYLQSGLTTSGLEFTKRMGRGSDLPGTSVFNLLNKDRITQSSLREFVVRIYFISPCSVTPCGPSADGGKPIPTLKMVELTASGMVTTPLVEGIENLQIDYGVDTTPAPGDGSPDGQFVSFLDSTNPVEVAKWANVMALRVHLLARSLESSPDYIDSKVYALGYNNAGLLQTVSATTDSYDNNVRPFKRRVFSQMVRLVNPSGRRDQ